MAALLANVLAIGTQSVQVDAAGATYGTPYEFTMGCCLAGGGSPFYPHETATVDVNRDGIPDYLVANSYSVALDVHLGHGDGTFAAKASYAAAGQPIGLAVGDLTGTGVQDVVVADGGTAGNHTYTVLMGNGDGTFGLGGTYSIAYQVNDVELGDLNGDGKLDVVVTCTAGEIAVLFGNGDGTFGTPSYYATHGGAQTATVADLNKDGHPDVVVAEGNPPGADAATVGVFLNTGNGTLATRVGYNIGNTYATSVNVAVGDLNGDGAPDLAVADGNCGFDPGHVEILLNSGAGAFVDSGRLSDGCAADVAITDATGSAHLDVVTVSYGPSGSRVSVYPGNGDGTFGAEADYPPPDPNTQYRTFAVTDLNRDGKPDVIAASGGNHNTGVNPIAAVYLNTTAGLFVPVGGPVTTSEAHSLCPSCMAQLFTRPAHADPVDTVDGTFSEEYGDLMIPGRGLPLMFVRTYNSWTAGTTGPLGFGWTSSYNASLSQDPATGVVTVTQENGSQATFGESGNTYAPTAPRTIATLVHNNDGSWTFTRQASETLKFSSAGLLTAMTDRNGYSTTLTYNGNNQLTQVSDPENRSLTLAYTGSLLSSVTDPAGRVVRYGYDDGLGNLTDVTDVNGGNTHFTYDTAHHLLTIRDPRGNTATTNHYDSSGRVDYQLDGLNQKTSFTYASDGSYTITTDPAGNQIRETFASGVRMSVTLGYGTSAAATWSFTYDSYTLGVTVLADPNGHTTNRTYDSSGNPLTVTDGLNRKTTYAYNSFNEPTTITDANNVTTTMAYDTQGNLLSTSTPLIGSSPAQTQVTTNTYGDSAHPGDVTAVTDPDSKVWHRAYDTYGDLASATDPLGDLTTYSYNAIGWLQSSVSPKGNVSGGNPSQFTTTYSYADPVTNAVDEFGDVRVVTDPLGQTTTTSYDPDRNVVSTKDGVGNTTTYQYDADNQQTDVQRADGTTLHTDYNADGTVKDQLDGAHNKTSYGYDSLAHVTSVTDPLQRVTSYTYDGAGNRLTMVDPALRTTTYTYDAANEQTAITYSDGLTPNVTNITYDADGQRTAMTDGTGTSSWAWDSLHRITSATSGSGQTVGYGYDLKGQLTALTYPNTRQVTRVYDDAGHLTSVTDWLTHTTSFGYDPNSNLSSDTYGNGTVATIGVDNADGPLSITDSNGGTTLASFTYTRNANEMLASLSSTGVGQVDQAYGYTKLNQVASVNTGTYSYDAADNLTALLSGATATYDAANEARSFSVPGNAETNMAYDSSGNRMTGQLLGTPSTFGFDQANRLTQVGDQEVATQVAGGGRFSVDLKSDGTVWAWGDNSQGQLGNGTTTTSSVPVQVSGLTGITAISARSNHVLALKSDGTVWAWGRNGEGELGNGTTTSSSVPVQVPGLSGVTAIAAGGGHSLAVRSDGTLWAWGENDQGEVGVGTTTNVLSPAQVSGLTGVTAISGGTYTSLAVKSDGTAWAWGYNGDGELGNGTYNNSTTPTQVPGLTGMTSVAAGDMHSLALKNDGTVWSWGLNDMGELGDGTTNDSLTPVEVSNLTGVTKIAAGWEHSLALKPDGTIWDWGYNSSGQLGNGGGTDSDVPVQPQGLAGVAAIAGGGNHSLAIRNDGTVWAWGSNGSGQLGYPDHDCYGCSTIPLGVIHAVPATYTYNGDGLRASTTTNGTTQHFAWDVTASTPLLLTDGTTSYIYGPGGVPIEQVDSSSNPSYLHQDALGSTRLLTNQSASVVATWSYDAYGNVTASSGTATTPFMFAGQYRDPESGLYYLRARYYDPTTAQFLSRDPLASVTLQPYAYTVNDPLNGNDPSGLDPWWEDQAGYGGPEWHLGYDSAGNVTSAPRASAPMPNAEVAFNYFVGKGLTQFQAAGIVGNLMQESTPNVDPTIQQPGGPGRGIAQWSVGGRWNDCVAFAKQEGASPLSLETQLDFMWHELNTSYAGALSALKQTTTVQSATIVFEQRYEAAGQPEMSQRITYAEEILAQYGT